VTIRIGIAGWSVPADYRGRKPSASHLEQYAQRFDCVEINSSFYKPHRFSTYQRWAKCVPPSFRFAAKLPKTITHHHRLQSCRQSIDLFCRSIAGLAEKLAVILVQLPPSLAFDPVATEPAFLQLRAGARARIVCEARHPSWFTPPADRFLSDIGATRAFADPRIGGSAAPDVNEKSFSYLRLHGQPRIYYSSYATRRLRDLSVELQPAARAPRACAWCIFDNTARGAAWPNALKLKEQLAGSKAARGSSAPPGGCIIECRAARPQVAP